MKTKRPKMEAIQDVIAMCAELAAESFFWLDNRSEVYLEGYTANDAFEYGIAVGECRLARKILEILQEDGCE